MTAQELNELYNEIKEKREHYENSAKLFLDNEIPALFEAHPKLGSFSLSVNNHEFNDGDATMFNMGYSDPTINEVASDDLWREPDEKIEELTGLTGSDYRAVVEKIELIFDAAYQALEKVYGDAYESVTFDRDGDIERD